MTDQRELGTPSRTAGPDYFRSSAFKPLAISTYSVRAQSPLPAREAHQLFMGFAHTGIHTTGSSSPTQKKNFHRMTETGWLYMVLLTKEDKAVLG